MGTSRWESILHRIHEYCHVTVDSKLFSLPSHLSSIKKKEMKNKKLLSLKMHCSTFWVCMWLCFLFLVLPARTASSGHWFFIPSTPNCLLWRICIFSIAFDLVHNAWPSVLTYKEENLVRKPSGLEPRSVQESCQGELRVLRWTWRAVHGSALLSTCTFGSNHLL